MRQSAALDKPKTSNNLASAEQGDKDNGTISCDQQDQRTQVQAAAARSLISNGSSEMRRQREGLTLFGTEPGPSMVKPDSAMKLPCFVMIDVDIIRIDPCIERYLRELKINSLYTPSSGLLTKESIQEVSVQEPIHVIRRDGHWWCIAGEGLLADAKRILTPPRFLAVVERKTPDKDVLVVVTVVAQIIQPARHQMDPRFFKARVQDILICARAIPALFNQHLRDDQWAAILRRSSRWFANAKKSFKKVGPTDGE